MDRLRPRVSVLLAASLTTLIPLFAGCSGAAEQPILNQFFTASRLRDNTTLDGFSMVALDPQKQGTVTSFSITNVSAEQRKPLTLRSLAKAHDAAPAERRDLAAHLPDYDATGAFERRERGHHRPLGDHEPQRRRGAGRNEDLVTP